MNGCIETTWPRNPDGYGYRRVNGKRRYAHRWAWTQANGPVPDGLFVLHHCDNPPCVKTEPDERYPDGHLFVGTIADNNRDMVAKGRQANGDRHGRSRLTRAQAWAIRERKRSGEPTEKLAAEFGVYPGHVEKIACGEKWAKALGPQEEPRCPDPDCGHAPHTFDCPECVAADASRS